MKKKWDYFWYYYKWHTVVAVVVALFALSFVKSFIENNKDVVLSVGMVNASDTDIAQTLLEEAYNQRDDVDLAKTPLKIQSGLIQPEDMLQNGDETIVASVQKFSAMLTNGAFDLVVSPPWSVDVFSQSDAYYDLEEILSADLYQRIKESLYYAVGSDGEEHPIGIILEEPEQWSESYTETVQVLTVPVYAVHLEEAVYIIEWLASR